MTTELSIVPNERAGQSLTGAPLVGLPSKSEMALMMKAAEILFEGQLLPESIKNPQAAFTIMLKGRELGISAMNAFASINVIKGKPTLSADLMVAILRRAGHKLWVVKSTDTECVMKGHRRDEPDRVVEIRFTYEDAKRAKLAGKDTWQQYPAQLLYARCASRIARIVAPDELAGMYTPEELGANVQYSEDGSETIIGTVEPTQPAAKPTLLRPDPDPVEDGEILTPEEVAQEYELNQPELDPVDYWLDEMEKAVDLDHLAQISLDAANALGQDHDRKDELTAKYKVVWKKLKAKANF